jgi:hypothetical protein
MASVSDESVGPVEYSRIRDATLLDVEIEALEQRFGSKAETGTVRTRRRGERK